MTTVTTAKTRAQDAKKALEAASKRLYMIHNRVGPVKVKGMDFDLPRRPELRRTAEPLRPYLERGGGAVSSYWSQTSVFDQAGNCLDKNFKVHPVGWSHEACAGYSEADAHRDYEEAELLTGPEPVISIGAWRGSPGGKGAVVEVHDSIEIPEWVEELVYGGKAAQEAADAVEAATKTLQAAEARLAEEKAKAATRAYKQARSAAAIAAGHLCCTTQQLEEAEAAARRRLGFA